MFATEHNFNAALACGGPSLKFTRSVLNLMR
jgi:hypothetical protein